MSSGPSARNLPPPPCLMAVFGAGGDLFHRLLAPSLYNLAEAGMLPERFGLVGIARKPRSSEAFRRDIEQAIRASKADPSQIREDVLARLLRSFHYWTGDSDDPSAYPRLKELLGQTELTEGTGGSVLFYLATPPHLFATIPPLLAENGMLREDGPSSFRRVVFEKPFGRDSATARALNSMCARTMKESQVFRIDHYLGKETVQNILVMRFANGIFEPIWNRRYVDSVQITVAETLGVEKRAGYYEDAGALRDMVPNHLFQLLALIGMEPPNSFEADDVRDEKVKLLKAVKPLKPDAVAEDAVRGQYQGYRREPGVAPDSRAETFVALRLAIDNWRWAGVPFYLRTGKRMAAPVSEVALRFRCAPLPLFSETLEGCTFPNWMTLGIQPEETISLSFSVRSPSPGSRLQDVSMRFGYADAFGGPVRTGYETLLYDAMTGDSMLFLRADQTEVAWRIADPILDAWAASREAPPIYPIGSWGPQAADLLLARTGRSWRPLSPAQLPSTSSARKEAA